MVSSAVSDKVTPVIFAGLGKDYVSKRQQKKFFSKLLGRKSEFQRMALKCVFMGEPIVICRDGDALLVREQLHEIGVRASKIIAEPEHRGISFSVALAALYLKSRNEIMCVFSGNEELSESDLDKVSNLTFMEDSLIWLKSSFVVLPCVYLSALRVFAPDCFKMIERSFYSAKDRTDVIFPSMDVFLKINTPSNGCVIMNGGIKSHHYEF